MGDDQKYIPINCSFYDYLEEAATLKEVAVIDYFETGIATQIESRIKTLFIKDKVEYVMLENGLSIRLDELIKFNGKVLPKSC
jgi:Rho-binding antiterminator